MNRFKWFLGPLLFVCVGSYGVLSTEHREKALNKSRIELPAKKKGYSEYILNHMGYTVSFNKNTMQPNWVAWELTAHEVEGKHARSNNFQPDPSLPPHLRVTTEEYIGSGYDRGHMAPSADMKWSLRAMIECFYMSNICPQNGSLNGGGWSSLEKTCRRWAKENGRIFIVCGPVFKGNKHKWIGRTHKIPVPEGFFKVVLSLKKGDEKAIGFYYRNTSAKQTMEEAAMSVDDAEALTGYDFYPLLPKELEKKIEAVFSLKKWHF